MPEKTGVPLAARKIVTVVFCDLVDSTRLGERLDPETFGPIMKRFYDLAREAFDRHGGTVQAYKGDAVLAAFGVPTLHEDDALRAVTAAVEVRAALIPLNEELQRTRRIRLSMRMGINTGETAVDERALVLGDPVNMAARLQQAAATGEILIGQWTRELVHRVAKLEQVPQLLLKGKESPVQAWRLLGVVPDPRDQGRRLDTPMVGRDVELAILRLAFRRVVSERSCHLVTVLGEAGIGKTKLVHHFEDQLAAEATVLKGRCPQYGENIDYSPFLQVVRQAAGIRADDPADTAEARLSSLVQGDETVAKRLAQMLGLSRGTGSPETASWALGRLIEMLAAFQPVVLVIDDLHWARPKLLDTLEQVAHRSYNAPVLLVCMARSEFRHQRSDWTSVMPNVTSFMLTPLEEDQISELITSLLKEGTLEPELRRWLAETALGYPLYAEEFVAMLVDQDALRLQEGRWTLTKPVDALHTPGNVKMLLAARLDDLSAKEKEVIGTGAVIGVRFVESAVAALVPPPSPGEPAIADLLRSLVRKEFLRPDATTAPESSGAYLFWHPLIQDEAYRMLPKKVRAALHEEYARWLAPTPQTDTTPIEEELALHLRAAYRIRAELGESDATTADLQRRAGERLAAAGRKAALRGDDPETAARLLTDAVNYLPEGHRDQPQAQLLLAESLGETFLIGRAGSIKRRHVIDAYHRAIEIARVAGDRKVELTARLGRLEFRWFNDVGLLLDPNVERLVAEATREFEWLQDDRGLARVWRLQAYVHAAVGRSEEGRRAAEHAIRLAGRAQDAQLEGRSRLMLCFILDWGPRPIGEVAGRVQETLVWAERHGMRSVAAGVRNILARAEAMQGRFDQAREHIKARDAVPRSSGEPLLAVRDEVTDAWIDLLSDDTEAAERTLRAVCSYLEQNEGEGPLANARAMLARALLLQGRDDEAEAMALQCAGIAPEVQLEAQIRWRLIQAVVLARRGMARRAVRVAREAIKRSAATEQLDTQAQAMYDLAEVLALAGRLRAAVNAATRAQKLWEEKGNRVSALKPAKLLKKLAG